MAELEQEKQLEEEFHSMKDDLDLPVPQLADNLSDRAALIQEQQSDNTRAAIRE